MKLQPTLLLLLLTSFLFAQTQTDWKKPSLVITPELMVGKTMEANDGFPDTKLQKQFILNLGRDHQYNPAEWAYRLKAPKTGIGFGITEFGNIDSLGLAFTAIPFIEFNLFKKEHLKALVGMGGSYFTKKFDPIENPLNRAVTTDLSWAFRAYFYYELTRNKQIDWRIGLGYSHHSNGHTRLPNQGYNSFLLSLSADFHNPFKVSEETTTTSQTFSRSKYEYISIRFGLGTSVLAEAFNNSENVYTLSGQYGKVYNNTFKVGVGFYYRMYQHYYDYIKNNESLVQDGREFNSFREKPWHNATAIGLSVHGEILLNHIGIDLQLGVNLHKPAYKIDWRLNEGWDNTPRDVPESWMLGEFTTKYKLKQLISSRMGLKYYVVGTSKQPIHNIYVGAHINSNLGQADFSEISLGYVYSFGIE